MLNAIKENLVSLLEIVLVGAVPIIATYLISLIKQFVEKTKLHTEKLGNQNQKILVDNALDRVNFLIESNVLAMQNTLVKEIKDKVQDKNITKQELIEVGYSVKKNVLNQLSDDVKDVVKLEIKDIDSYIKVEIENVLEEIKSTF